MKDNNPDLFKIVGSNEKYLNDKDKWIKHYRIYICLIMGLLITILAPIIFIEMS